MHMDLTNKRKPVNFSYSFNNTNLEQVKTYKYLGVILDGKLSWAEHVNQVKTKAMRTLNLLRRTLHGCNKEVKAKAYTALVRPQLETCCPVWTPHQSHLVDSLESVQKRAGRWICAKWDKSTFRWSKSYEQCRSELNWKTVKARHRILMCCQVYKVLENLDCLGTEDFFKFNSTVTRASPTSLCLANARVNVYRYSFFVNSPSCGTPYQVSCIVAHHIIVLSANCITSSKLSFFLSFFFISIIFL